MTELAPFRERPKFLLCPRCGEMLERAFEAVLTCLRCEGLWIAKLILEKAFGDPRWPGGSSMWWRNSLECPECASEGAVQAMTAMQAGDVLVDRCPSHGLWLDRTELARLLEERGELLPGSELELLRAQLPAADGDLEQLARRREAWRSDLGQRRKAAQEYRAWLEAEQRRRIEREREAREREAREREEQARAEEDAREREQRARSEQARVRERAELERRRAETEREFEQRRSEAERDARLRLEDAARRERREEARREHERAIERLEDSRAEAGAHVARVETQIIMLRDQLRAAEAELGGARARLRAIEDQLAALRGPA